MKTMTVLAAAGLFAAATLGAGHADAATYGVFNITGNANAGTAGQFSFDVVDAGGGLVDITLANDAGGVPSSIEQWNFDDSDGLFASASIFSFTGTNVAFSAGNPVLPGGNSMTPQFTSDFGFVAGNPAPQKGINAGESLTVRLTLNGGFAFADVIASLSDSDLRMGFHVIAYRDGGSDSFVNNPDPNGGGDLPPVPLPAAAWLLISGLGGLGVMGWRKRRTA